MGALYLVAIVGVIAIHIPIVGLTTHQRVKVGRLAWFFVIPPP